MASLQLNTKQFLHSKISKTFIAEASTLGADALPLSIALVSHVTGKTVTFTLRDSHISPEREVISWRYTPLANEINKNSKLSKYKLIILND
jgi:hypothetical protein